MHSPQMIEFRFRHAWLDAVAAAAGNGAQGQGKHGVKRLCAERANPCAAPAQAAGEPARESENSSPIIAANSVFPNGLGMKARTPPSIISRASSSML